MDYLLGQCKQCSEPMQCYSTSLISCTGVKGCMNVHRLVRVSVSVIVRCKMIRVRARLNPSLWKG